MSQMARQCASASSWADAGAGFPSLPSYIAATSGDTQGVTIDANPAGLPPITADKIFRQVRSAGLTEKSYQEGMPSNCGQTNLSGVYVVRHNPAAYYQGANDRAACLTNDVPMGTTTAGNFLDDLNTSSLPNFSFITPNLCNDMHDCPVATGDSWLNQWLPMILDSPTYRTGRTAIFVVWDENTPIPNIEIAPSVVPGTIATGAYSHYSLLRTTEEMLGIPSYLLNAATAPSMRGALNF